MQLEGVYFDVTADTSNLDKAEQRVNEFANSADDAAVAVDKFGNELTQADKKTGRYIDSTGRMREANGKFVKGLKDGRKEVSGFGKSLDYLAEDADGAFANLKLLTGVTASFITAAAGLTVTTSQAVKEQQAWADATGVSLQTMQEWSAVAKAVGKDTDFVGDVFKDATEKIGDFVATGGGEAKDVFEKLNLDVRELAMLAPDQQILKIAGSLGELQTRGEKIFLLESLANDASLLLPLLEDNAEGLGKVTEQARQMGIVISDADAAKLKEVSDEWTRVTQSIQGLGNTLSTEYAGDLASFLGSAADVFTDINEFVRENRDLLEDIVVILGGAALAYGTYTLAVKGAIKAQIALNAVMTANPVGLIVKGLALAGGALAAYAITRDDATAAENRGVDAMHDSVESIRALGKEQVKTAIQSLELKKAEAQAQLDRLAADRLEYNERVQRLTKERDMYAQSEQMVTSYNLAITNLAASYATSAADIEHYQKRTEALTKRIAELNETLESGSKGGYKGPLGGSSSKGVKKQVATYEELLGVFDKTQAAYNTYYSIVQKINESSSTNAQKTELLAFAFEALQQELYGTKESYSDVLALFDDGQIAYDTYYDQIQRIADSTATAAQKADAMAVAYGRLQDKLSEAYALDDAPEMGDSLPGIFGDLAKLEEKSAQIEEWYANQIAKLDEFRLLQSERTAEWDAKELEAAQIKADKLDQIERSRQMLQLKSQEELFGGLTDLARTAFGEQSGIYKAMFLIQKGLAISQILMNAEAASIAALAPPPIGLGPVLGAPVAAGIKAKGYISAAIVGAQALTGMAHDGIDRVPQEGTWLLNKGERVTTENTSNKLDRTLDDIRSMMGGGGGSVSQNIYVTGQVDNRTASQIAQATAREQRIANSRFGRV